MEFNKNPTEFSLGVWGIAIGFGAIIIGFFQSFWLSVVGTLPLAVGLGYLFSGTVKVQER